MRNRVKHDPQEGKQHEPERGQKSSLEQQMPAQATPLEAKALSIKALRVQAARNYRNCHGLRVVVKRSCDFGVQKSI